jgi:hypothetical protein
MISGRRFDDDGACHSLAPVILPPNVGLRSPRSVAVHVRRPRSTRAGKNGTLILSTPYHGYLKDVALAVSGRFDRHCDPLWDGGHIKFWSKATLGRLLTETGFEVEQWGGAGRLPRFWKSMIVVARMAQAS